MLGDCESVISADGQEQASWSTLIYLGVSWTDHGLIRRVEMPFTKRQKKNKTNHARYGNLMNEALALRLECQSDIF